MRKQVWQAQAEAGVVQTGSVPWADIKRQILVREELACEKAPRGVQPRKPSFLLLESLLPSPCEGDS